MGAVHDLGWLNYTFPQGTIAYGPAGVTYTQAMAFTVKANCWADKVAYYRPATGATGKPTAMAIWRADTQTKIGEVTSLADDGTVGWQDQTLSTPVALFAGIRYKLSADVNSSTYDVGNNVTSLPQAGLAFNWSSVVTGYRSASLGYPNVDDTNGWIRGLDVHKQEDTDPPATPDVGDTLDDKLADWLISTSDNTHQTDGLPWLTKTVVDAVKVVTDKLGSSGSGNSLDWISSLWRLAGDLTDAEIGLLKSLLDRQGQITGASGGGGSAFYGPEGTQVSAGVETLLGRSFTLDDLGAATALLRERLDLSPDLADTTRWTLVDTIEGSADALVNVQADAYFFNLTTIPSSHPHLGVAATLWVPRWGWVAPRVHAHFRQRQFSDVFPVVFTADGLFMDGILVHALPGFEWTCECYTLDRS
jgi:hypothetical protein